MSDRVTEVVKTALWQFNEAVSLLRDARAYVGSESLRAEIDQGLPAIVAALHALAGEVDRAR